MGGAGRNSPRDAASAHRRQAEVWAEHFVVTETAGEGSREFETDRQRFLGRGNTLRRTQAMRPGVALSNTIG